MSLTQSSAITSCRIFSPVPNGTAASLYIESMGECTRSSKLLIVGRRSAVAQNQEYKKR